MSPIYDYECEKCHKQLSLVQTIMANAPTCCNMQMKRKLTFPAMIKIKGEGGYPSRRKFVKGTAPGTTRSTIAWEQHNPLEDTNYMGTQDVARRIEANKEKPSLQ